MAKIRFDVDEAALQDLDNILAARAERVVDMSPAWDAVARDFRLLEDAVFATQGRILTGGGWRPLSEGWLATKRRRGLSTRILEASPAGQIGRLRRSLTQPGAPYSVERITGDDIKIGTKLGIAKIHQTGGTFTSGGRQRRMPRRRFVQVRAVDRKRWVGLAAEFIATGAATPGRIGL